MFPRHLLTLAVAFAVPAATDAQTFNSGGRAGGSARAPVPGAPAGVTAFVDVAVIPMDTERVLPGHTVVIENGWITALGPNDQVQVPAGALRIDGRGRYLLPGLADMHVHMHSIVARDSVAVDRLMIRYLADGVTTVRNMDHMQDTRITVLRLRDRIAAGEVLGPRIYTSGRWRPDGANSRGAYPPEDIAPQIAVYKAAGYDHIKVYSWDTGPMFDSLMAAARRVGLPVSGHIPNDVTVRHALAAGMKSFEHNYGYFDKSGAKFEPEISTDSLAVLTRKAGVWNTPTYFWWHPERGRINKALQDAGVGLLLGTDAPEPRKIPIHLAELVRAGLTPYQALATGTKNVAGYFGTMNETGTVAVGKRADLVLLSGNPLQDTWHTLYPAGVMVSGRWLPREELDRRWATLNPQDFQERKPYWYYVVGDALKDAIKILIGLDGQPLGTPRPEKVGPPPLDGLGAPGGRNAAVERQALVDSLVSNGAEITGRQRIFRLLARQLGESRAALPPERRAVFDARARVWLTAREREGYRVEISGIR